MPHSRVPSACIAALLVLTLCGLCLWLVGPWQHVLWVSWSPCSSSGRAIQAVRCGPAPSGPQGGVAIRCVALTVLFMCPGLAVGLDPQGYGNPDFCWLSLHDSLIWSLAGPIGAVILVSAGAFTDPLFWSRGDPGARICWKGRGGWEGLTSQ